MKIQTPRKQKPKPTRKPVKPATVPYQKPLAQILPTGRKRNGPIKGSASAARCTGRIPRTIEEQLDTASEEFMLRVLRGESFEYQGPTGKRCNGPAPIATRASIASTWLKKRRPDLTATAVQAHLVTEDITPEDLPSDRQLSRLIGQLIFESQLGTDVEPKAIAAPVPDHTNTPPWVSIPEPEAEEGDMVSASDPSLRRKLDPAKPQNGDKYEAGPYGAYIRYYEGPNNTQGRWHIMDANNIHHATNYTFDKSIKHAQGLPEPTGAHQIDPWETQRNLNEQAENLDRRKEAMPLGPPTQIRNIRQAPRLWRPHRGGGPNRQR